MIVYQNLIVVGTSHIAQSSLDEVERVLEDEDVSLVALELDKSRLLALIHDKKGKAQLKDIRRIGFKGYLFARLGEFAERKMGDIVGVKPGEEMLKAFRLARDNKIHVALIDQNIEVTLKKFSKSITYKEKWTFMKEFFKHIFRPKKIPFDLRKVPDDATIQKLIDEFKEKYPSLHYVLVEERNEIMAKKLEGLMKRYSKIVAVVGAGHEKEIVRLLGE